MCDWLRICFCFFLCLVLRLSVVVEMNYWRGIFILYVILKVKMFKCEVVVNVFVFVL